MSQDSKSWLLQGLFTRPSLNFILGTPGSKKTWLALDLAVSVALGRGWLGYQGPATSALYMDEELGLTAFQQRLRSVFLARRAGPKTPFHFSSITRYDLAQSNDVEQLAAQVRSVGAGLIVIDNLANSLPLMKGKGWGRGPSFDIRLRPAIANLLRLAQSVNASILVLLHTCKRRTALGAALVAFGVDHVLAIDAPYGQSWVHLRTLAAPNLAPASLTAEIQIHQPRLGKIIYEPEFLKCSPSFVQPSPPLGKAGIAVLDYLSCKGQSTSSQLIRDVKAAVPNRILSLIKELSKDGYILPF